MFSLVKWQALTTSTAAFIGRDYALDATVIAPFGFEVLDKISVFLNRPLRRFYIYIGVKDEVDPATSLAIQVEYLARLFAASRNDFPMIFERCHLLISDRGRLSLDRSSAELTKTAIRSPIEISTEIRHCSNILDEYAKYIIWTAFAIRSKTLPELSRLGLRLARRRVLQLHLIHLHVFQQANALDVSDLTDCLLHSSGTRERSCFDELWKGRIQSENRLIVERVSAHADALVVGTGLHGAQGIDFWCDSRAFAEASHRIKSRYLARGGDVLCDSDHASASGRNE